MLVAAPGDGGIKMIRTLGVYVDRGTWPAPPALPRFPASFPRTPHNADVNILGMLLTIGFLTTPSYGTGVTLSEYWAWVRYLHAVADDGDLRLTSAFAGLDPHQKTILSDDFGMGVPMYWLAQRMNLHAVCDGKYFIDRVAASVGAVAVKTAKRGPNKSPDFVAQDANGTWHVIECKGTQSGGGYRATQLGAAGPPPSGAVAQKRSIIFPPAHTGQRLATGLFIGVEHRNSSSLRIIDPPGEKNFEVTTEQIVFAKDAVERAAVARALRLAGFEATASAMASPSGRNPASRSTSGFAERRRRELVQEKSRLALEELQDRSQRRRFTAGGETFRGRSIKLDFPVPVWVNDRPYRAITLQQGVRASVLTELVGRPLIEEPLPEANTPWRETLGQVDVRGDGASAELNLGGLFHTEIELLR
jgi:hypothetical protein